MFIKPFPKYNKTTKERYTIYRLCESYRFDGHIRHRSIIGFGKLDELPGEVQKKQLAWLVEEMLKHGQTGFQLEMLKEKGYGYLCVSRSTLKDYYADTDSTPVTIKDKRQQPI